MFTYQIPSANITALTAQINKINKKADKLNLPHVSLNVTDHITDVYLQDGVKCVRTFDTVEIVGKTPIVEDYQFIAACDIVEPAANGKPSKVVTRKVVDDITIPEKFISENTGQCDHCNTSRCRKYTFIVRNINTGEFKQIGKSCLKDYFNQDMAQIVSYFEFVRSLIARLDDGEDPIYAKGTTPQFDFEYALSLTFAVIRESGYQNASSECPTKYYIQSILAGDIKVEQRPVIADDDIARAQKAMTWLETQEVACNDFLRNVKILMDEGHFNAKFTGYVCGLAGYYAAQETKEKKAEIAAPALNEHVGTAKERIDMTLTLINVRATESYYGTTYIHNFIDDKGRSIVWFASKSSKMEKDCTYKVKATVKGHDEFRGTKQTKVNRITVI